MSKFDNEGKSWKDYCNPSQTTVMNTFRSGDGRRLFAAFPCMWIVNIFRCFIKWAHRQGLRRIPQKALPPKWSQLSARWSGICHWKKESEPGHGFQLSFLSNSRRVCIVCGKLSKIFSSVVYPKGKNRRKEFDNALCLPIHVSDALPAGCYICGSHFPSNEISYSMAGPAQITESTVPSLVS